MNIALIKELQSIHHYPCVSLIMPTHRTLPENEKDGKLLKNLLKEAEQRLLGEFTKREIQPLLNKLAEISEQVDMRHNLDGLALFVNENRSEWVRLPFPVRTRVVIDRTFATRDLIMGMNRSREYLLLSVSSSKIRLFEAIRQELNEVENEDFPMDISDIKVSTHEQSMNLDQQKLKESFNQADKAMLKVYHEQPLPVVIAGVEDRITWFMEIADKNVFKLKVTGNYDKHSVHDFGKEVWPHVQDLFRRQESDLLHELENARGVQKQASGLQAVWALASEGRIAKLLVEEDYHVPGTIAHNGQITIEEDAKAAQVSDDIIDELAELVMIKGGEVRFLGQDTLSSYDHIAAILRF